MSSTVDRGAYCRELEAYLCRKNDGHLIRIVGPTFERVMAWAAQGIPIKVAQSGIDRYFDRQGRRPQRRRPVRLEFCEADILDAFDDWRRAVGVSTITADAEGGPLVEDPSPLPARPRRSLRAHLDQAAARLTVLRGSDRLGSLADEPLDAAIRSLESLRQLAEGARGEARHGLEEAVRGVGMDLARAIFARLPAADRAALSDEARLEIEPFRARMTPEACEQAVEAAVMRLVRDRYGLPDLSC